MSDADIGGSGNGKSGGGLEIADSRLNTAFDVLAGQRCRYTLHVLRTTADDVVSATTLADAILTQDPDADDHDRVLMRLHHQTLPRLDGVGIIDYDPRTHTVRYHGDDVVDSILDSLLPQTG